MTDGQKQLFRIELGAVVATPGALEAFQRVGPRIGAILLRRHLTGDWGDLSQDDREANDRAATLGDERILSAYKLEDGAKIWIITEADRSVTTFLLPEEY